MKYVHMMLMLSIAVLMTSCSSATGPIVVERDQDVIYMEKGETLPHSGWVVTDGKMAKILLKLEECER